LKRFLAYSLSAALIAAPLTYPVYAADENDEPGGLLVDFLQDTLSDDSRTIRVTGLEGTFSSRATIEKLTVADSDGIWLTLENAELDWNRLALLKGEFSVNRLGAERIEIARAPLPAEATADLPSPEAQPFSLPDLPVAIELGDLSVDTVILGKSLIGEPALLRLNGKVKLAGGALDSALSVRRLDRQGDGLELTAGFANETRLLSLDLALNEGAGGLVSTALSLPGRPEVLLSAKGNGPLEDFTADIRLATAGQDRLAGQVVLKSLDDSDPETPDSLGFFADLGGDLRALMPADYQSFFGSDTRLQVRGQSDPDGAVALQQLDLRSAALDLTGTLALAPGGRLSAADVTGQIRPGLGAATVLLPMSGPPTRVTGVDLALIKRPDSGDAFDLDLNLRGLTRPDMSLTTAGVSLSGTLDQQSGFHLDTNVNAALNGLSFTDPDLSRATGRDIVLTTRLITDGEALRLQGLDLKGESYQAAGDFALKGLTSGLEFNTRLTLTAADLGRFSGLAGQDLGGRVSARIAASGAPLSGTYAVDLDVLAQDLSAGIEQVDPMLTGSSTLQIRAERGFDGIAIDRFTLDATGFNANASGTLTSRDGTLRMGARLHDLSPFVPQTKGALELSGDLTRKDSTLTGDLKLSGPNSSFAELTGTAGFDGSADLNFDAVLGELQRFVPEIAGSLKASGTASRRDGIWQIDTSATGPAGIEARVDGTWNEAQASADMTARGQLRLDAANLFIKPNSVTGPAQFDLVLRGAPSLRALSGTITASGASLALPEAKQSIRDIAARISLAQARANVQVTGTSRSGGSFQVSGPVTLEAPYQSGLDVALNNWVVTDNLSYSTTANGRLSHRGALTGSSALTGTISFDGAEINLSNISGSVSAAPIPEIRHIGEPATTRRTLARAGLSQTKSVSGGNGPDIALDILLSFPRKIFARGRGLQAELGGEIRVRGTAANAESSGQVELIRGTFDILGRRLELTRGIVTLQGDLTPYLEFQSTTNTSQGTATLEISGPMDAPEVKAHSQPERPSEEVMALLLFGDQIENLSPVALAQLAASVARLSGRGGAGKEKVRKGIGADSIDLGSDSDGATRLGAGAYLNDDLYTSFSVNTRGESELKLNLDLTDNVTVKGSVDHTGQTGIGIFFERDY